MQRPLGTMLCYLHPEGYATAVEVEFHEYQGRLPTQFYGAQRQSAMYELCLYSWKVLHNLKF